MGDKKVGHETLRACSESVWKAPRGNNPFGSPRNALLLSTGGPAGRSRQKRAVGVFRKRNTVKGRCSQNQGK